jgi:hypothetical protein
VHTREIRWLSPPFGPFAALDTSTKKHAQRERGGQINSAEDFDMRISQSARLGGLEKAMLLLWRSDISGPIRRMSDP